MKVKLREIAEYVNIKINSNNLSLNNYISTENMLPDRKGISMSSNIPNNNVNKFLKNDILISNIRPYFKKIWFAIFEGGASNDILVIRGNNKVNSKYLYYLLSTDDFFDYNVKGSKGTKMPRGDKEHIMNYEFKLPSLKEQKRIADILTALDDKIELNNQMNQTLEEIASLLYKRWFVDFEFPDDKGNPYKSSDGEMVDSELGMIPKGWEVKELEEFITLINGYAFKSGSYSKEGNYKIITIKNVLDNKFITNSTNKILEIPDNVRENQKLKIGDVLISLTGNVGRVCVVTEGECLLNQRVAKIISKIEENKYYWRTFFNTEEIKIKMINISKGTAQSNLSTIEIMKIKILNSKEVTYNFSEKIKAISKKKLQNEIMILNIEMIKQKLLEELV
jgi:type I restriction enzyme S subunit